MWLSGVYCNLDLIDWVSTKASLKKKALNILNMLSSILKQAEIIWLKISSHCADTHVHIQDLQRDPFQNQGKQRLQFLTNEKLRTWSSSERFLWCVSWFLPDAQPLFLLSKALRICFLTTLTETSCRDACNGLLEGQSHNPPDKETTTFMAVFFRRFWEKGQTHSSQTTRVGNIPVCIHRPLLSALHHLGSWGCGTIIRKPLHWGDQGELQKFLPQARLCTNTKQQDTFPFKTEIKALQQRYKTGNDM